MPSSAAVRLWPRRRPEIVDRQAKSGANKNSQKVGARGALLDIAGGIAGGTLFFGALLALLDTGGGALDCSGTVGWVDAKRLLPWWGLLLQ